MNRTLETESPAAQGGPISRESRPPVLPPLKSMAVAAVVPNLAVVGAALVLGRIAFAGSDACGLLIGLLMYAGIYSFVNGAASLLVQSVGGRAGVDPKGFMPQFALLTLGKFLLIGGLLFVMFRLLHVNIFTFAVGFIITQVAITVLCVGRLKSTPLLG